MTSPVEQQVATTPPETPHHIAALDGVRGIAVLSVLIFHGNGGAQSSHKAIRMVSEALQLGWAGVTLFFVLSGFLITNILWASRGRPQWWRRFYIRRALRIFPLYYLALGIGLAYSIVSGDFHAAWKPVLIHALYLQNILMVTGINVPIVVLHFWSLAVEEQFYLVWPWLLAAMPNLRAARRMCVITIVGSFALRWIFVRWLPAAMPSTPAHAGDLAMGAWLALTLREKPDSLRWMRRWAPAVLVGGVLIAAGCGLPYGTLQDVTFPMEVFGMQTLSFAAAALVVLGLAGGRPSAWLSREPLQHVGVISYGLYVYHLLFWHQYGMLARWMQPHASAEMQLLLKSGLMLVCTFVIAEISYRLLEKPILAWKDRLAPAGARPVVLNGKS